jgi:3-phenylpropionate/cinnamic acid dioxygenase small subunit
MSASADRDDLAEVRRRLRQLEALDWLNHEAMLLDDGRFDEWLELLDEDVSYQMPVRLTRERGERPDMSFGNQSFLDDRSTLELRIRRLDTEFAWAEDPPSRTRRFVTNVRVEDADAGPGADAELRVRSYLLLYRNRGDETTADLLSAERSDVLRRVDGRWLLRERLIRLDQGTVGTKNLALLM